MPEVPDAIRRYFAGVNNEDWEDFRGIWHPKAELDVVGGMRFRTVEDILAYFPRVLKSFPVHYDDPYAIHVAGDVVTVEIAFTGKTVEGVEAAWEAVDVFYLEGGLIRRETTWYDMPVVVRLLAQPGTPDRRLQTLVEHAAANSPYYRRRLGDRSLEAGQLAAELALLPPTRPEDVAAEPDAFWALPAGEVRQILAGSVDGPPRVPLGRVDLEEAGRLWAAALKLAGVTREDVVLALSSSPGLAEGVGRVRARVATAPGASPAAQAHAAVALGATALAGSTDAIAAVRARAAELDLELPALRDVEVYERPETGVVAAACPGGTGFHVLTEGHVAEIVERAGGGAVRGEEEGDLVVTPLGRRAMPLLRYVTGDSAAWLTDDCGCGSSQPRIALVPARVVA